MYRPWLAPLAEVDLGDIICVDVFEAGNVLPDVARVAAHHGLIIVTVAAHAPRLTNVAAAV